MLFFIVGNRYGGKMWEMFCGPFSTLEEAQAEAAKIPRPWNATVVSTTTKEGEKANEKL